MTELDARQIRVMEYISKTMTIKTSPTVGDTYVHILSIDGSFAILHRLINEEKWTKYRVGPNGNQWTKTCRKFSIAVELATLGM